LADIYGQYGRFRNAEECVAAIRSEGVMLAAGIFCALANAFAHHGLCEQTVKVLEVMEAEGFEINLVMLNLLVNAFSNAGRHLEALTMFQHIKDIVYSFCVFVSY
jgi:pentatricopeptide repeat protein